MDRLQLRISLAIAILGIAIAPAIAQRLNGGGNRNNGISSPLNQPLLFSPDATYDIGASGATRPRHLYMSGSLVAGGNIAAGNIFPSSTGLGFGGATGISQNANATPTSRTFTIAETVDRTAFVCAAVTCDVTIFTTNPRTFVQHVIVDLTQTFACASVCTTSTLSFVIGKTAGGNQYLLSVDADAATGQFGVTAAQLGASLAPSTTPTEIGDLPSWTASTNIVLRMTSGTGNIGNGTVTNFSQGSMYIALTGTNIP